MVAKDISDGRVSLYLKAMESEIFENWTFFLFNRITEKMNIKFERINLKN